MNRLIDLDRQGESGRVGMDTARVEWALLMVKEVKKESGNRMMRLQRVSRGNPFVFRYAELMSRAEV